MNAPHPLSDGNPAAVPLLVAYDITDNRQASHPNFAPCRTQLHRLLRGFGEPLQKSLFLCWVIPTRRLRLERLIEDFLSAPHKGHERIDCLVARDLSRPREAIAWVLE